MKRLEQIVLIGAFVCFCWLAMQVVHELGHMLGAIACGGRVVRVVLHPLALSRTDVDPNPRPLLVVWAGPVVGCVLPLLVLLAVRVLRLPGVYLYRFFAGFCLVANGIYIGLGSLSGLADAGDMLRHGSARWQLLLFGALVVPSGLHLWHGLGPAFGFGQTGGRVSPAAVVVSLGLLCLLVAVELAFWRG